MACLYYYVPCGFIMNKSYLMIILCLVICRYVFNIKFAFKLGQKVEEFDCVVIVLDMHRFGWSCPLSFYFVWIPLYGGPLGFKAKTFRA